MIEWRRVLESPVGELKVKHSIPMRNNCLRRKQDHEESSTVRKKEVRNGVRRRRRRGIVDPQKPDGVVQRNAEHVPRIQIKL